MKICFFATSPYAVKAFLEPHIANLSKDHNVTLLTSLSDSDIGCVLKADVKIDIPIKRRPSLLSDILILFKLVKLFYSNNFDVVHTITPKAGFLGMVASRICGVPYRFHTFTGQHWSLYFGISRYFYKCIDKLIVHAASKVFSDGQNQLLVLEHELCIPKGRIQMLGPGSISGVDLSRFTPSLVSRDLLFNNHGIPANSFIFLFVGRLCADKGVYDIFSALKNLNGFKVNIEVWFVGPDEESVEYSLEASEVPKEFTVRYFGRKNNPEIYMQSADVLLLPSYREGFGSVLIEANACGLPVICYDIYGVKDAVQEGVNGMLVKAGCIKTLTEKMIFMVENQAEKSEIGKRGIAISKKFDSKIVYTAWVDFYNGIAIELNGL